MHLRVHQYRHIIRLSFRTHFCDILVSRTFLFKGDYIAQETAHKTCFSKHATEPKLCKNCCCSFTAKKYQILWVDFFILYQRDLKSTNATSKSLEKALNTLCAIYLITYTVRPIKWLEVLFPCTVLVLQKWRFVACIYRAQNDHLVNSQQINIIKQRHLGKRR